MKEILRFLGFRDSFSVTEGLNYFFYSGRKVFRNGVDEFSDKGLSETPNPAMVLNTRSQKVGGQ